MRYSANTRETRVVVPVALRALEAQRLVSMIAFQASPALAAGLIAYVHMGSVGNALLVTVAMLAALQLVEQIRHLVTQLDEVPRRFPVTDAEAPNPLGG